MTKTTCIACGRATARESVDGIPVCDACHKAMSHKATVHEAGVPRTYLLRDIPGTLWQVAKHAAVDRGVSLRDLLLTSLKNEIGKDRK